MDRRRIFYQSVFAAFGKESFRATDFAFRRHFWRFCGQRPDGWGRLLVDRQLLKHNINPIETESLDRLAIVGSLGMGALQYVPEFDLAEETQIGDFDDIARECSRLLATNQTDSLDELFRLGSSSGGARPKILTEVNGTAMADQVSVEGR